MRLSKLYVPTLKEDPAEAEVVSHRLLLRAGLVRKVAAGIYSFLPLGQRVLTKVENIVREEMMRAGAQEVLLPALHPAELWKETERWQKYGPEMMRLKDRNEREFCLGPTHEEVITDLVRGEVRSYRQLPLNIFQIQVKFRDEPRPRFGLMRGREFIMKDGYSFHADEAGLKETYQAMREAYTRIFTRCGLTFRIVRAATGIIGGEFSHEFMVLAKTGEDEIIHCPNCGYAANRDIAARQTPEAASEAEKALERVATPEKSSVREVASFLSVTQDRVAKTLIFRLDEELVAVIVGGDRDANPAKLAALFKKEPELLEERKFSEHGLVPGFVGPIGLTGIRVVADLELRSRKNLVIGANAVGEHFVNANIGKDFEVDEWADVTYVTAGEACPDCGNELESARGIEAGQIFQLGSKYSEAMGATFVDQSGKEQPFVMGCYGIGVSRLLAAAVEQNHDSKGIKWPLNIAPYEVIVLALRPGNTEQAKIADRIYAALLADGSDVVIDDREVSPRVKFTEADLVGYPIQIVVGDKAEKSGKVEIRRRSETGQTEVEIAKAAGDVAELAKEEREKNMVLTDG